MCLESTSLGGGECTTAEERIEPCNHGMMLALKWPLPSLSPKSPQADGVQDRKLHLLGNGAMVVMIITSGGVAPSRECLEEPEF